MSSAWWKAACLEVVEHAGADCLFVKVITLYEVVEADPDVHLELDEKGKIMGIEIWNAQKSGLIKQVAKTIAKTAK